MDRHPSRLDEQQQTHEEYRQRQRDFHRHADKRVTVRDWVGGLVLFDLSNARRRGQDVQRVNDKGRVRGGEPSHGNQQVTEGVNGKNRFGR